MTSFEHDRAQLAAQLTTASPAEIDAELRRLHATYHEHPLDHVRVHVAWIGVHLARKAYLRAFGHAFAGFVVAAPASLVQRYTGLLVPAFRAPKRATRTAVGLRAKPV